MSWWKFLLLERARGNRLGSRRGARLVLRRQGGRRRDHALRRVRRHRHRCRDRACHRSAARRAAPRGADVKSTAVCLLALCALLAGRATAAAPVPAFDHVVVIVFENKESASVLGNRAAPTFNTYGRRYARLTRYYGVTHPSLPNYLALVSGSTQGSRSTARAASSTRRACGHDRGIGQDVEDLRGGPAGARLPRRLRGPLCEEAQSLCLLPEHRRRSGRGGRGSCRCRALGRRSRARGVADFSLVVPDLCQLDARLLGLCRRHVAARSVAARCLEAAEHGRLRHLRRRRARNMRGGGHIAGAGARNGRPPRFALHRADGPLWDPAHDRARVGAAAPRALGPRRPDHRHLALAEGKRVPRWNDVRSMLAELASALAARDPSTAAHCARVTFLARRLATWLGWDEREAPDARGRRAAPRHRQGDDLRGAAAQARAADAARARRDPDAPGGGREADRARSARRGTPFRTSSTTTSAGTAAAIRPDGAGPQIPEGARLLAVADAFDAMTSTRPYRRALPTMRALGRDRALRRNSQFDPTFANAFLEAWDAGALTDAAACSPR